MKCSPLRIGIIVMIVCSMVGCANKPLSSIDRTKYGRVTFDSRVKAPKEYFYTDTSIQTTSATTAQFGLVGALIGGTIVAVQENNARKQMDQVVAASKVTPEATVFRSFKKHVEARNLFQVDPKKPGCTFSSDSRPVGIWSGQGSSPCGRSWDESGTHRG